MIIRWIASSAEWPNQSLKPAVSLGATSRNRPEVCISPTMRYPRIKSQGWVRSGHRNSTLIAAIKPGRFVRATCLELKHLCKSNACSRGWRANAMLARVRLISAATWIKCTCQTSKASTTKATSGSGQTLGWKGVGRSLVAWMWASLPRPGGTKWSNPRLDDDGYRCPDNPA